MKEIIESIQKNLTGDSEKDTPYLLEQLEKYRDNIAVSNEIYKMLFNTLPKNLQENFVSNIKQSKFEQRLRETQELVVNKKYQKALDYLDMAIEHIHPVYEDEKYVYKTYHNPLDAYISAINREDKTKLVKNSELDFGVFHKFRGIILYNLGRLEEALAEFVESFKWNDMDTEAMFNYAEVLLKLKKYDEYLQFNLDKLKVAYLPYTLATIYHNIGLYYMARETKKDDLVAFNIISYSIAFEETDYAYKDLNTICEKYKMKKELANEEDVFKTLADENIPQGPDFELIKLLIDIARKFIGSNDEFALSVFRIIYRLTHDETTLAYINAGEKAIAEKNSKK